jgi:hypothetical protein
MQVGSESELLRWYKGTVIALLKKQGGQAVLHQDDFEDAGDFEIISHRDPTKNSVVFKLRTKTP